MEYQQAQIYGIALIILSAIHSYFDEYIFVYSKIIGMRMRVSICTVIYSKVRPISKPIVRIILIISHEKS